MENISLDEIALLVNVQSELELESLLFGAIIIGY